MVVTVSASVHVNGLEWELELSRPSRIAATSPTILDIALGERLDVLLTTCENVIVAISLAICSVLKTAV